MKINRHVILAASIYFAMLAIVLARYTKWFVVLPGNLMAILMAAQLLMWLFLAIEP